MSYQVLKEQLSSSHSGTAASCLKAVRSTSRVVDQTLMEHANSSLGDYVSGFTPKRGDLWQLNEGLAQVVRRRVAELFDESLAQRAVDQLQQNPVVLTTNHHGIDYFAQSVQGTIALSRADAVVRGAGVVVVLACGNIPLDNLTYPQGMLVYDPGHDLMAPIPRKLPLMSNSKRRQLVSAADPFDSATIARAQKRIEGLITKGEIRASIGETGLRLLQDVYQDDRVIQQTSYSAQATVANHLIWQELFETPSTDLVYLELEQIAGDLIIDDLVREDSINSLVLFDSDVRSSLITALDQSASCWNVQLLNEDDRDPTPAGGGTILFWAVTSKGRPIALRLNEAVTPAELFGYDSKGECYRYPLTSAVIVESIQNGQLIPSLFMSFLNIAMLRNTRCLGGYYQAEYLPAMARGLNHVLDQHGLLSEVNDKYNLVQGDEYLSGMQMVVVETQDGLVPAGPLEILASGGLTADEMQRLDQITIKEAHLGSLLESVGDLPIASELESGWQAALARDLKMETGSRLITKRIVGGY